jgi:hypothetical protein
MQPGSGRHVWGLDPARLAAGQHRGHAVDMRAPQGGATGFQAHLGGESHVLLLATSRVRSGAGSHLATCFIKHVARREATSWDLLPQV